MCLVLRKALVATLVAEAAQTTERSSASLVQALQKGFVNMIVGTDQLADELNLQTN